MVHRLVLLINVKYRGFKNVNEYTEVTIIVAFLLNFDFCVWECRLRGKFVRGGGCIAAEILTNPNCVF